MPLCIGGGTQRDCRRRGRRPRARWIPGERQAVLETLHSERFLDQAPAQVHATLLDEGTYLCSPRTMYRLLDAAGEVKERRDQVRRPHTRRPSCWPHGPTKSGAGTSRSC